VDVLEGILHDKRFTIREQISNKISVLYVQTVHVSFVAIELSHQLSRISLIEKFLLHRLSQIRAHNVSFVVKHMSVILEEIMQQSLQIKFLDEIQVLARNLDEIRLPTVDQEVIGKSL
jgi:hypothetical protein